jgi:hypothetical protein
MHRRTAAHTAERTQLHWQVDLLAAKAVTLPAHVLSLAKWFSATLTLPKLCVTTSVQQICVLALMCRTWPTHLQRHSARRMFARMPASPAARPGGSYTPSWRHLMMASWSCACRQAQNTA